MPWIRGSTVDHVPVDPVGQAVAESLLEIFEGASVELVYWPPDTPPAALGPGLVGRPGERTITARASAPGPVGWQITLSVELTDRSPAIVTTPLRQLLEALPGAGLRAGARLRHRHAHPAVRVGPALHRALRDSIIVELLSHLGRQLGDRGARTRLIEETIEFLIELSGTRVESQDVTHGVVITSAIPGPPGLAFAYPADLRSAKRGPLLFDGLRSVLLVDQDGHPRTELQKHRFDRIVPDADLQVSAAEIADSVSLVGAVTRLLGGLGFFLRDDRTIWVFIDGRPLLVRRAEHWTAFPLELAASIGDMTGADTAAELVVQTALLIAAQRHGAILAMVNQAEDLDGIVSPKDRFDLRNELDPMAMRVETRLHHLIDAGDLDPQTLARLATLDGATVVDRTGQLLAYGAIVASADSEYEGARTAAAKTLSESAAVVLKISVDGDITVFQKGRPVATLLGQHTDTEEGPSGDTGLIVSAFGPA